MKLTSIVAVSMALAFPAAICAQQDEGDLTMTCSVDAEGVDLVIRGGYSQGKLVVLVSVDGVSKTEVPEVAGSREIHLGAPVWVLAFAEAEASGRYDLRIPLGTQTLADLGLTVFVQAVGFKPSSSDESENESGAPIALCISNLLELDFATALEEEDGDTADRPRVAARDEDR
jgi:hypothetical protein